MSLTVGSLFTGVGGFDLGLERAGMKVAWQVEKDDYCRSVLARHWPDVTRYERVEDVGADNLKPVDLVCGGFPCQPVSSQGKREGERDRRWLWPEFRRVVREMGPPWVLLENTAGLAPRGLGTVLGELAESGYDAEWQSLSPCYVGAPHHRGRLFILAYPRRQRREGVQPEPRVFREEAAEDFRQREPTRGGRTRRWRQHGDGIVRPSEPAVGRVADGVPDRVDRIRALGNAIVPQIAQWIGERIVNQHSKE